MIPDEGVNVERLEGQAGVSFNLSQIEAALEKTRPKAFFITHGESSTGCLQNLEGIGALCHKYGALCCVDSVAACGGVPLSQGSILSNTLFPNVDRRFRKKNKSDRIVRIWKEAF